MATLEQIKEKMKKLQTQADALIAKRSRAILDDIHALMAQHNLTSADIDAHQKSSARRGAIVKSGVCQAGLDQAASGC
jgi:ABC-type uncharacterized transport system substrate-binding protein